MKKKVNLPAPLFAALKKLGQDISEARRRRRIPIRLMAERANLSRTTIGKIEKGDSTTSMGGYASALFVLGMTERLRDIADASHDLIGRQLEDERLPKRIRILKNKDEGYNPL